MNNLIRFCIDLGANLLKAILVLLAVIVVITVVFGVCTLVFLAVDSFIKHNWLHAVAAVLCTVFCIAVMITLYERY